MNSITDLLDLEDGDLCITETQIQGQTTRVSAKKFGGFRIPH